MDTNQIQQEDTLVASESIEPEVSKVSASTVKSLSVIAAKVREATACYPLNQKIINFHHTHLH